MRCDSCMQAECALATTAGACPQSPGEHSVGRRHVPSPRSEPTTSYVGRVQNRDAGAAELSGRECRMRDPCPRGTDCIRADGSASVSSLSSRWFTANLPREPWSRAEKERVFLSGEG